MTQKEPSYMYIGMNCDYTG